MTTAEVIDAVTDDLWAEEAPESGPPPSLSVLSDPFLTESLEGRKAGRAWRVGDALPKNPHPLGSWWHFVWGGAMLDEVLKRR